MLDFVKDNYSLSDREIAIKMNIPFFSVSNARKRYNLPKKDRSLVRKKAIKEGRIKIWSKGKKCPSLSGKNNPFYNKHHTSQSKQKISDSNRLNGNYKATSNRMKINNPTKNGMSKAWRNKIGLASKKQWKKEAYKKIMDDTLKRNALNQIGKPNGIFRKLSKSIEFQKKRSKAMLMKPNIPEKILIEIIKKNNFPFEFIGDGKEWFIGKNSYFNPDFLCREKKIIIEVFGDYWHNILKNKIRDKYRLETYFNQGYKTIIFWEHELIKRTNLPSPISEEKICNRINKVLRQN